MSIDSAIVAVAGFLQPLMPTGVQIVRGMANNVPPPKNGFIVITEVGQPQYTTTRTKLDGIAGTMAYVMPRMLNLQLDFYGLSAGEMSGIAVTMLRSNYATERFPDGVEPLYCSNAMQAPLITGEKQFETRWLCTLSIQYNSAITVEQESFIEVGDILIDPVDVTIPAE
jgi:hypothetical protein